MSSSVFQRAVPDAGAVLKRFPVAIAGFAVLAGTLIHYQNAWSGKTFAAWATGCSATAFAAVAVALWSEARVGRARPLVQLLALGVGLAAAALQATSWLSVIWLHALLVGAILLAPAPRKSEQQLWSFDTRLVAMAAFSGLAAGIVVLGLVLILLAAQYLFGFDHDIEAWTITLFGFVFAMPTYWLALAPRHDAEALGARDLLAKAAGSLGALIAAVTTLMAALLYVYTAKVALVGELPKNQVGWIVSSTLAAGLVGWLLSAGDAGPLIGFRRFFRRWWFPLTAVPVILLAAAIRERIGAYGVTLDRYTVAAAAAASFGFLALAVVARGAPSIRGVLAVSLLVAGVAAFGPFNMPSVVADSQVTRLKEKLAAAGVIKDGRIAAQLPGATWTEPAAGEMITIINEIYQVGAQDRLKPLIPADSLESAYRLQSFLAADYGTRRADIEPVEKFVMRSGSIEIGAGTFVGQFAIKRPSGPEQMASQVVGGRLVRLEARRLTIFEEDRETAFDLSPLDAGFEKAGQAPLSIASADGRSTLIVSTALLRKTDKGIVVYSINGSAVIAKP